MKRLGRARADSLADRLIGSWLDPLMYKAGSVKAFEDNTLKHRLTPGWLRRIIAVYNVKRQAAEMYVGGTKSFGILEADHEIYHHGFADPEKRMPVGPGESCLVMHMSKIIKRGAVRQRLWTSLYGIHEYLGALPPANRPKYVAAAPSPRRLAHMAMRIGFEAMRDPPIVSDYSRAAYSRTMTDMQREAAKAGRTIPTTYHDGHPWVIYMPVDEFQRRFQPPNGTDG